MIDGYKRIAALEQLGRDTVEATVWAMSEAEARPADRGRCASAHRKARWNKAGCWRSWSGASATRLEELARRFDRSASWVSRRLALVELLPEAIQQQVREGKIAAQVAMKYLVPVARVRAGALPAHGGGFRRSTRCDTRQAGQLYAAWREGTRAVRERILAEPELFLKTQRQPPASHAGGSGTSDARSGDGGGHPASRQSAAGAKRCRRWPAGNRSRRSARSKVRAGNWRG